MNRFSGFCSSLLGMSAMDRMMSTHMSKPLCAVVLTTDGDVYWSCTSLAGAIRDLLEDTSLVCTSCPGVNGCSGKTLQCWQHGMHVQLLNGFDKMLPDCLHATGIYIQTSHGTQGCSVAYTLPAYAAASTQWLSLGSCADSPCTQHQQSGSLCCS